MLELLDCRHTGTPDQAAAKDVRDMPTSKMANISPGRTSAMRTRWTVVRDMGLTGLCLINFAR
ncbi:hypothetical protein [Microbispora sp. NPDC049125]|uniref:hypothetical protein n=1 Tax=Microbispora sp. NPDC049125 TaxID=3154929 RepID=UPI0034670711